MTKNKSVMKSRAGLDALGCADATGVAAIAGASTACTFTTLDVYAMKPFDYDASLCVDNPACGNI